MLGQNTMKPVEVISPDTYKISVIGLSANHRAISISDGLCSPHVNQYPPHVNQCQQRSFFSAVEYPPHVGLKSGDPASHDFAMYILQESPVATIFVL